MPDFHKNLWAPWRMAYIRSMAEESGDAGCFLCRYWSDPHNDEANHVVWRGRSAFAVLNRFPYSNGHLLIAHAHHRPSLTDLSDDDAAELAHMTRAAEGLLRRALRAEGFNIGYNLGRCAGAGLPDHLHGHVVPRWSGDTNFMCVPGDVRVIPEALDTTYAQLVAEAKALGLRS